jgi:hypothetical protein
MLPALGVRLRPSCWRTFSRGVSWISSKVPLWRHSPKERQTEEGREVLGQVAPLAAGPQLVEDGVPDIPHVRLAEAATRVDRDGLLDEFPLLVGHVAGILKGSHPNDLRKSTLVRQVIRVHLNTETGNSLTDS